ncbi:uncharacterized protein TNCT_464351 [Trichonephila clavata]|uniref:Uncharacterized protein n=1 Tax=Trichonephila clavata TaxID=2740835 RepID=A0A8X6LDW7_TRICU|nr:uncharacterized protein TNCT_464351 [Trichonephila clavata]
MPVTLRPKFNEQDLQFILPAVFGELIIFSVLACIAITECRYPYEDTYRAGDIVPYANERRQNDRYGGNLGGYKRGGGYPIPGRRDDRIRRDRYDRTGPYDGYMPSDVYPMDMDRRRRRNNSQLRPRGLGGNKKYYGSYDYEYNKNRRPYPRKNTPGFYSYDDSNYDDYSDTQ